VSRPTRQAIEASRRAAARRRAAMLEDLDWILDTDAAIRRQLRVGDTREARALVAARMGLHPESFDRFLRSNGRSVATLRPPVAQVSTAV
jgi:hypothetical protein